MSEFAPILYWLPGVSALAAAPAAVRSRWVAPSLGPDSMGPVPGRGLLVSAAKTIPKYLPNCQRWEEPEPGVWCACALPVRAESLIRTDARAPYTLVPLADGQPWRIPVVNPLVASCALPKHDVRRRGAWQAEVQPGYRALADRAAALAGRLREALLGGAEKLDVPDAELRALVADALALNYDLTESEAGVLRLWGPDVYWPAVAAVLDWPAQRELILAEGAAADATRNPTGATPATPSTAPGAPAPTPAIGPPAPTSGSSVAR